jgi:hypothetical protein
MTSLTLKRASSSRPDGQWSDEDYDELADGKVVARILQENTSGPPELRWGWSITVIVPATRGLTNGHATTRTGDGEVSVGVGTGEVVTTGSASPAHQ